MDNSLDQTGGAAANPHLNEDPGGDRGDTTTEQPAPCDAQTSFGITPGVLTIVPAPRPYAYRRPTGHSDEDDTSHPLRRRSDFDPQK